MENGGIAHFDAFVNVKNTSTLSQNIIVAIYRGFASSSENPQHDLVLVDYANASNISDGRYRLDVFLEPGMYAIQYFGNPLLDYNSQVNIDLSDYTPEEV